MSRCVTCNKKIIAFGGIKDSDSHYCSSACWFRVFFPKLAAALARLAAANPSPLPAPAGALSSETQAMDASDYPAADDGNGDLSVILIGSGVSVAVAALIYWLVNLVGYPFHLQSLWFVIPVGAYLCGMVAGVGYWLSLRWFDRRPTGWTYLFAGLGGAFSYVVIYVLMWWMMEFEGTMVREVIGFSDFLQLSIEHQRIRFEHGQAEGFEVGKWGYPKFAINVLGFALGVVSVVAMVGEKPYCPRCRRYLRTVGKQVRSSSDPEATAVALQPTIAGVLSGRIQEAVDRHAGLSMPGARGLFTTTIAVAACPGCGVHLATLTASIQGDQGRQDVEEFTFHGTTSDPVQLAT